MSADDIARLAAEIRNNIEQYDFSWDSHYKTFPEELATALVAAGWVEWPLRLRGLRTP